MASEKMIDGLEVWRMIEECQSTFSTIFNTSQKPTHVAIAPGRVNLIGEHVDYAGGIVLPMAIPLHTVMVGRKVGERGFSRVFSRNLDQMSTIHRPYDNRNASTQSLSRMDQPSWSGYVRGVMALYAHTVDVDIVLESTVPIGGGLSSSAALEVATLGLLRAIVAVEHNDENMSDFECALLCQQAEHDFAGVPCGIMDQFVVSIARNAYALKIDCRAMTAEPVPIDVQLGAVFLVTDSGVRHSLADTAYADRRRAVEKVARIAGVSSLRELDRSQLEALKEQLNDEDPVLYQRAEHVIDEIDRTERAVNALLDNNLTQFGQLMHESHVSLRDKFEVSCSEMDFLVELQMNFDGVFGCRMTGGGFGGCTVALLRRERVSALKEHVENCYTGTPKFYECYPVQGLHTFQLS